MFSIQMLLHFSQIVQRVCTLVLFIILSVICCNSGLHFWKVGSHKIYAVRDPSLNFSRRLKSGVSSNSSDEDLIPTFKKRRLTKQRNELGQLSSDVRELRKDITKLFEVNKQLPISDWIAQSPE